jgi:CubicO group peptidase (beta-lactamase class C family)
MDYLAPGGNWYDASKSYSDAKPGTEWSYSNVGGALLGYLAERLSGKSFDVFTRERIFRPLGMSETSWRYEGVRDEHLARPYDFASAHFKRLERRRYPDWPAGLLCTNGNDFAKFLASYTEATLLKPETIKTMFTPNAVPMRPISMLFPARRQGLIWELAPMGDSIIAFHNGGDPGTSALAAIDVMHRTAALCFANISPTRDKGPFEKEVINRLLERANA